MQEPLEYGPDILTLMDEEGTEHEFEVIDTLELEESSYLALIPVPESEDELLEDEGQLVILKNQVDENGEEYLEQIEDEEEFERVSDLFMERLEDYYEFDDSDEDQDE